MYVCFSFLQDVKSVTEYMMTTNRGLHVGVCTISPPQGVAFVTRFVIDCVNWKSSVGELSYSAFVKEEGPDSATNYRLLKYGTQSTLDVLLPSTAIDSNNRVELKIEVIDLYGAYESVLLNVQVSVVEFFQTKNFVC